MKKVLTIIGIAVAALFCIGATVTWIGEAKLARQGFSAQERDMIRSIKSLQLHVNSKLGRETPKFIGFTHPAEVLDYDGTLLGYSMDGKIKDAVYDMRYFFLPGETFPDWWNNVYPNEDVDEKWRQHLKGMEGLKRYGVQ